MLRREMRGVDGGSGQRYLEAGDNIARTKGHIIRIIITWKDKATIPTAIEY